MTKCYHSQFPFLIFPVMMVIYMTKCYHSQFLTFLGMKFICMTKCYHSTYLIFLRMKVICLANVITVSLLHSKYECYLYDKMVSLSVSYISTRSSVWQMLSQPISYISKDKDCLYDKMLSQSISYISRDEGYLYNKILSQPISYTSKYEGYLYNKI